MIEKAERVLAKINETDKKLAETQANVAIAAAVLALIESNREITVQSLTDWLLNNAQASSSKLIHLRNEAAQKVLREAQTRMQQSVPAKTEDHPK